MAMKSILPPRRGFGSVAHLLQVATFFIATCVLTTGATAQILHNTSTSAASALVKTDQVRAELIAHAPQGVEPGQTIWAGLQIQHQPHWHTYWQNPGDSGLPTTLQWTLPPGVSAGAIAWPTPQRQKIGNLVNYGFEGTVLLPVPLTIGKDFVPNGQGALELRLAASWLVCRQECIPQEGQFVLQVPAKGSTAAHGATFAAASAAAPAAFTGTAQARIDGNDLVLGASGLPASWHGKALQVFPEGANLVEPGHTPHAGDPAQSGETLTSGQQGWNADRWQARIPLSALRETAPAQFGWVLAFGTQSLRMAPTVQGAWPALPTTSTAAVPTVSPTVAPPASERPAPPSPQPGKLNSFAIALAAALIGGFILNLMPCVLPVLAIKVLGFTTHSHQGHASHRAQGLAYTAGVVVSFLALGGLMLFLRAAGEQLGWGFQLQSPWVVAVLAALFTLIGLNLAGLFEVGTLLPHTLASLQARHPVGDAFLSGVLAVAVASPCTAPFMGASLGYAIALPAAQALGIFAALGLGLALPFLVASWIPSVGQWLPRPGAWMDTLRRFMAFPMFATVVWLVWVLGHLSGVNGAGALLALLLALGWVIWSLGLQGRSRAVFATLSIATTAVLTGAIGPLVTKLEEPADAPAASARASGWQPWSDQRVQDELAAGRPVFVDFTAAWCITCQYNKKTTLADAEVLGAFAAKRVTLLRADWTRRDPTITVALEQLGRSGVPVYVLLAPGREPVVFSEILDAAVLRQAVTQL